MDPGDAELLRIAAREGRVTFTIDSDFGTLIFRHAEPYAGLVRFPDVPAGQRIVLMEDILRRHGEELRAGVLVTVRGGRIRISG